MLLKNATLAGTEADQPYGLIARGAVVIEGDKISWAGPETDLPTHLARLDALDLEGRLVTPGLIDCHTHIVHGGNRAREFEMRLDGASYEPTLFAGGTK